MDMLASIHGAGVLSIDTRVSYRLALTAGRADSRYGVPARRQRCDRRTGTWSSIRTATVHQSQRTPGTARRAIQHGFEQLAGPELDRLTGRKETRSADTDDLVVGASGPQVG